tara:strand:+ start:1123 stop:3369 length:2247 start_codon:yes stop_codon:yes gene_type:complete
MKSSISLVLILSLFLPLILQAAPAEKRITASERLDQLVLENLKTQGLEPTPPATDEIFLRRIYMDVIGRAPTKAEAVSFLENAAKNKRAVLIRDLLNSEGYISHSYNYFADLLRAKTQISGVGSSRTAGYAYERWIKDNLRENKPYDELVYELLTASGQSWKNGAVGYYLRDYGMPLDNLAITTQVFLGSQIVCAQCHNHPFDSWTQMDYYHLSAFTFGMMTTNQAENSRAAQALFNRQGKPDADERRAFSRAMSEVLKPLRFNNVWEQDRKLRLPHDYQYSDAAPKAVVQPAVPYGEQPKVEKGEVPIHQFAQWMTSPENPRFTKVIANRLWKRAMGLGLIEPVDDMREDTNASNPALMTFLERRMVNLDYDMKRFLQMIYLSDAYQRESSPAEVSLGQAYHFPGPVLRRLSAEQIWDSLVAMVVEDVDRPSQRAELVREQLITRTEWVANGVYDLSSEDLMELGIEIAAKQQELADRLQSTQEKVAQAREDEDAEKIRAALNEAALVRGELAEMISNSVYRKGLQQKAELVMNDSVSSDEFLAELATVITDEGLMEPQLRGESRSNGFDGGQYVNGLVDAVLAPQIQALEQAEAEQRDREMEEWAVDTAKKRTVYKTFVKTRRSFVRASDIRSPAPNGHFLREFGQSDRELVENANDQASITQALALMNGTISNGIMSSFSVITRDLRDDANPTERLDTIYLTMLSRLPTAEERKMLLPILRAEGIQGSQQVIWTLLNTRQFLFLQ